MDILVSSSGWLQAVYCQAEHQCQAQLSRCAPWRNERVWMGMAPRSAGHRFSQRVPQHSLRAAEFGMTCQSPLCHLYHKILSQYPVTPCFQVSLRLEGLGGAAAGGSSVHLSFGLGLPVSLPFPIFGLAHFFLPPLPSPLLRGGDPGEAGVGPFQLLRAEG